MKLIVAVAVVFYFGIGMLVGTIIALMAYWLAS